jgi:hypothetical protein
MMPYVKQEVKDYLDPKLADIKEVLPYLGDGELNYIMTECAKAWIGRGYNYSKLNAAHGTFHSAGAEFYRRVVAPYEDEKIKENGDVY